MRQTTMSGVSVYRDPRFLLWLALVTLLAAAIREHFVLATIVDHPFVGDVRQYVFYAWNLVHHGVFSLAPPQIAAPPPDAYRSPGYPWLISLCMMLRPNGDWYALMLQAQVLLGTATVALTGMLGRLWLPRWAALWAAALLAFWPHHVAATGALLSEVLFGFTLIAALLLYARGRMPAAGAMFGFSYLVNPLIGLFPIVLALLHKRDFDRRKLVLLLGVFLLPVAALAIRNATIASTPNQQPGRLATNLVQGSWPLYHAAQNDAHLGKAVPAGIMRDIGNEMELLDTNPTAGLAAIGKRMGKQPGLYLAWYVWDKPRLLWDWDIRVGVGGPYVLVMRNSPLEKQPLMHAITQSYRTINPVLTLLAACGVLAVIAAALRERAVRPGSSLTSTVPITVASLAMYLTALHAILQSEPRYANAYRGIEALLITTAAAGLIAAIRATVPAWFIPAQRSRQFRR